ncbi:MAG: hypothetical protein WC264_02835 [Candidatus Paceibacterota bacterium]|jgi:hypothetical protein
MASIIKNIIIFIVIAAALILAYTFFFKKSPDQASLVSTTGATVLPTASTDQNSEIGKDFLSVLLNVKKLRLDDTIFSDPAFNTLHDSSILLIPDGTEGRPNPFAPIGSDLIATPINSLSTQTQSIIENLTNPQGQTPPATGIVN